jgi:hypothetical protein
MGAPGLAAHRVAEDPSSALSQPGTRARVRKRSTKGTTGLYLLEGAGELTVQGPGVYPDPQLLLVGRSSLDPHFGPQRQIYRHGVGAVH